MVWWVALFEETESDTRKLESLNLLITQANSCKKKKNNKKITCFATGRDCDALISIVGQSYPWRQAFPIQNFCYFFTFNPFMLNMIL